MRKGQSTCICGDGISAARLALNLSLTGKELPQICIKVKSTSCHVMHWSWKSQAVDVLCQLMLSQCGCKTSALVAAFALAASTVCAS